MFDPEPIPSTKQEFSLDGLPVHYIAHSFTPRGNLEKWHVQIKFTTEPKSGIELDTRAIHEH